MNDNWPGIKGPMKTNTILQYDENYDEIIAWGAKALADEPSRRDKKKNNQPRPVELFKFHLGKDPEKKPELPIGVTPERAITDYLREMGNIICLRTRDFILKNKLICMEIVLFFRKGMIIHLV